jgi:uncharacterized membrane protein
MLWARLPFQLLFIAWVYRACLRPPSDPPKDGFAVENL